MKFQSYPECNPNTNDWDTEIAEYKKNGQHRIPVEEFATIYMEESQKQNATYADLVEGLKAIDPIGGEAGTN